MIPTSYDITELLEPVEDFPNVYRLPVDDYLESEYLGSVYVNNGFVLTMSYPRLSPDPEYPDMVNADYSVTDYMLMHVARPEVQYKQTKETPGWGYNSVMLLADGTVVIEDSSNRRVSVYEYDFRTAGDFTVTGFAVGCTDDGVFWSYDADAQRLYQYDVRTGRLLREYTCEGVDSVYRLIGAEGNRYRFACFDSDGDKLMTVDASTGEAFLEKREFYRTRNFYDYEATDSEHTWYLRSAKDGTVVSFRKGSDSEEIAVASGSLIVTTGGKYDEPGTEDDQIPESFGVYDLAKQQEYQFRNMARFREVTGTDYYSTPQLMNGSVVMFYGDPEMTNPGVFLWDFSKENTTPMEEYAVLTEESGGIVENRVAAIYDTYGIRLRYQEYDLRTEIFDYQMLPITDEAELLSMIDSVEDFLAMYPDGFWREIPGKGKSGVDFFICREFVRTGTDMIAEAAAVVNISWPTICMGVCAKYASQVKQTLVHETMHMMEHRLSEYADEHGYFAFSYWTERLNTDRYPYHDAYTDENGDNISDYAGTYSDNPAEAWFIDAYSRSNWKEDRARIIENLYAGNKFYFRNSPHLRAKAEYLCAIIRAAFPSVAACKEPVLWEKPLGIIDPEPYLEILKKY